MNNTSTITFRQALVILEQHFDSTYRGIKTVREMCSDLTDAMYWDKEDPNTIHHQFETKSGPNHIVKDDQIVKLASLRLTHWLTTKEETVNIHMWDQIPKVYKLRGTHKWLLYVSIEIGGSFFTVWWLQEQGLGVVPWPFLLPSYYHWIDGTYQKESNTEPLTIMRDRVTLRGWLLCETK